MAILHGWDLEHEDKWLSVSPVIPTVIDERDLYEVEFYPNERGDAFKMVGSVRGWQTGHAPFHLLASAFCHIDEVMEITASGKARPHIGPSVILNSADWLEVMISCARSTLHEDWIVTRVYALDQECLQQTGRWRFAQFHVYATPEAAREFGESLMIEVDQAKLASFDLEDIPETPPEARAHTERQR